MFQFGENGGGGVRGGVGDLVEGQGHTVFCLCLCLFEVGKDGRMQALWLSVR